MARDPLQRLIHAFSRLPSIGEKSATRLTFFLLNADPSIGAELSSALREVQEKIRFCSRCAHLTEEDPCWICRDARRDAGTVCVVESPSSLMAIEKTGEYRGRYHVLHGLLNPLEGIGPEELQLAPLLTRIREENIQEVILATSSTIEGEATAIYLHRLLTPLGPLVSRIASGIPIGADLQYADALSLARALEGRRRLESAGEP